MLGVVDFCVNKICPCGEVCLTLNALGILFVGLLYHFVATVYGLILFVFGDHSECIELEMFKRITGLIYTIWFLAILLFISILFYKRYVKNRSSNINDRLLDV